MKIRCIKANTDKFTTGKIYEVVNGVLASDDDCIYYDLFTIDDVNRHLRSQFEEVKEMTKEDLKVGYVVVYNNGKKAMIMPSADRLISIEEDGWHIKTCDLNNDLTCSFNNNLDIKSVYGFNCRYSKALEISTENRELLWQREKPIKEVTMSELEKMFGCEVKIINDKEV